jgi:hypothetical protein
MGFVKRHVAEERFCGFLRPVSRYLTDMPHTCARACFVASALLLPSAAHAQVDCWAPREAQDLVSTQQFMPIRQTLLTLEDIIRRNAAYQAPPEPVRMRTTIAAGPSEAGGARIFVRAYPPVQTTAGIRIWTKDRCDVIPQAERVAASVGQIYVFINYNVQEQFLQGTELPKYEGEYAGYPIYNGWIVMTKDRRLPWIPQTLRDRLDREEQKRQRALDDWNAMKAGRTPLDEAAQMKTYEMLRRTDPAGAEKFLASMREVNEETNKAKAAEPITDAHLQGHLKALRDYRASFTEAQLDAPAVWMDRSREGQKRLEAQIAAYQQLTPDEQQQVDTLGRESRDLERQARTETDPAAAAQLRERSNTLATKVRAIRKAHTDKAFFLIQDARATYDLTNLKPGAKDDAMAFKPDPAFPNYKDPFRPQVIMVNFWSKSDPKDNSPRTTWLRQARETFDIAAVAALLR